MIKVAPWAAGMPGDLPLLFCFVTQFVCMLERSHAVFTEGVYFSCEAVCSYRLHQVDNEEFVEQYPVASVLA